MSVLALQCSGRITICILVQSLLFRLHFICVYVYVFYALFLLYLHQKRFIALRHRYLTARESQHMWTTEKPEEIEETEQTETGFRRYPDMVRSWLSNQLGKWLKQREGTLVWCL